MSEQIKAAAARVVKRIGPDHPITVEPASERVTVRIGNRVVADTTSALVLREATYPPAYYLPRADVDDALVRPSATTSYCPYKGDATYLSFDVDGAQVADAGWTYEHPYEDVSPIAGHVAFYPDRVTIETAAGAGE